MRKPSVCAAISKDQQIRLQACNKQSVVLSAIPESQDLASKASLLMQENVYQELLRNMNQLPHSSAIDIAIDDIEELLDLA